MNTTTDKRYEELEAGDELVITARVKSKHHQDDQLVLTCESISLSGATLLSGQFHVLQPEAIAQPLAVTLPHKVAQPNARNYDKILIEKAAKEGPLPTAVVHPVDSNSLLGAIESAQAELITPILVGPEAKIRAVADKEGVDISGYTLVDTPHSHAAAETAVQLVHQGQAMALMKGKLHTDEFMGPIVAKVDGLRTGRRMSHVLVVDIPSYHKPLFITDAALNIYPKLSEKKDMVQNAIDLFRALCDNTPKVAIVSAVETVEEAIPTTLEATALCKMADRGQIQGGLLDGPLAFDNAISKAAAEAKNIVSPVAGDADIIVCPDMEAANMLSKQLTYLFGIEAPGIILGARVPIILTSRAATAGGLSRQASCAMALLYSRYQGAKMI